MAAERTIAVGDLNGGVEALIRILGGTRLIDSRAHWAGGRARLVQVGDVFNRGDLGRAAFRMLLRLSDEAAAAGGEVVMLLGNHEAMMALRNEAYCTVGEYLSFASERERAAWPDRARAEERRLHGVREADGGIAPVAPRLDFWKLQHVPGREELRRAFGPNGRIGRAIRRLPVIVRAGDTVLAHSIPGPEWARLGVDGLNRAVAEAWASAPECYGDLPPDSIFRDHQGPLWSRALARSSGDKARATLERILSRLGARRIVVGHNPTDYLPGGRNGEILSRFDARLVCIDVGLSSHPAGPLAALVLEDDAGYAWTPSGLRPLWPARAVSGSRR